MKYQLASSSWDEREIEAAYAVLKSGKCTMGNIVKEFEEKFALSVGSKYAVMSNSGSSANLLAISALRYGISPFQLNPGDEIIVPVISWATTYYPIHQTQLTMRFVDIDLDTLNIDENKLEAAITSKTKAIFAVNLLGNPNNFSKIKNLCKQYNLILIIDNCESQSAVYDGEEAGSVGDLGTYSFFFSHMMSTIEGGMTVCNDKSIYERLVCLRAHGWLRQLEQVNTICNKTGDVFEDSFKFILPGFNLRPTELNAAIGLVQLDKLPSFIEIRRNNYKIFINEIKKRKLEKYLKSQKPTESSNPSWFGFSVILSDILEGKRKVVSESLIKANIECRPIVAGNFTRNLVVSHMDHSIYGTLENAERVDRDGLFIGNNPIDLTNEIIYFFDTMETIIRQLQ